MANLKAPFPYFGGKSTIAHEVWEGLGEIHHYIEPFFGSGAVLLNRPNFDPKTHIETINDKDGFITNVWRSLQFSPDVVAKWCDWPVNHADLMSRKKSLIKNEEKLLENLVKDDTWHDPKMAGYWIWANSCWIGSGLTRPGQIPHIANGGKGVHALGQRPHIANGGKGVHALGKRPHIADGGEGTSKDVQGPYNTNIYKWFRDLSERLRYVRVVCGDWTRVCGGNWQDHCGLCGIFFDPPYGIKANRTSTIYHKDSLTIADDVRQWALERGDKESYRIILAGYFEEHQELLKHGWRFKLWRAVGGYANIGEKQGKQNRLKEALFLSPHCIFNEFDFR